MTIETIAQRRALYEAKIAEYTDHLIALQVECEHIYVRKVARSDTGNWSKADDRYWYDCECPECRKRWTEDQ